MAQAYKSVYTPETLTVFVIIHFDYSRETFLNVCLFLSPLILSTNLNMSLKPSSFPKWIALHQKTDTAPNTPFQDLNMRSMPSTNSSMNTLIWMYFSTLALKFISCVHQFLTLIFFSLFSLLLLWVFSFLFWCLSELLSFMQLLTDITGFF